MHALGMTLLLAGFSGILAFGTLGASRSLPIALTVHAALLVSVLVFWIKKAGSLGAWCGQRVQGEYSVHPSLATAMGFVFGLGGVAIMFLGTPSTDTNGMDRGDIVYFGTLFLFLGSGLSIICGSHWNESQAEQLHRSGDG